MKKDVKNSHSNEQMGYILRTKGFFLFSLLLLLLLLYIFNIYLYCHFDLGNELAAKRSQLDFTVLRHKNPVNLLITDVRTETFAFRSIGEANACV